MGTVAYMAPEQAEDPRNADTRSDIYSFGATFYHALTGGPPFEGETHFAVLLKHKLEPLTLPEARCPDLSTRTSDVIARCLAKSPNDRFQSFSGLLLRLKETGAADPWAASADELLLPSFTRFDSRFQDYLRWGVRRDGDSYEFPGGRRLNIVCGIIVDQDAEVIVSSDNSHLTMSHGVSQAIRLAAGDQVRQEAQCYAPVRAGRAVVTSGGSLYRAPGTIRVLHGQNVLAERLAGSLKSVISAAASEAIVKGRFIFHGVTVGVDPDNQALPSRDLINEIMNSCFYHADTLDVERIAFPLLGTGAAGFSREVCLDTMFRHLARALSRGVTSVREVTLVLFAVPLFAPGRTFREDAQTG